MRVLAAHQPQYLPWLGWFDKLAQADVFVLLDNVQFKKNDWQNRNRIKGPSGAQWLTVPVRHRFPQSIAEVEVPAGDRWARKHLRALETNYGRAPHFADVMPMIEQMLTRTWSHLAPLNGGLIERLAEALGIDTELRLASELSAREHPTLRLVDLCAALDADTYLSGAGGDYLEPQHFKEAGLALRFQRYEHPTYAQLHGEFVPNLSVVDLLMNCGPKSGSIILSGRLPAS